MGRGKTPNISFRSLHSHVHVDTCTCVRAYTKAHHTHSHTTKPETPETSFISFLLAIKNWPTCKKIPEALT